MDVDVGSVIAAVALVITLASVWLGRRAQTENLSLAQIVAANKALSERVDRVETELSDAHEQLEECTKRENRLDHRDQDRLRRIIRLEDALMSAGIPIPPVN